VRLHQPEEEVLAARGGGRAGGRGGLPRERKSGQDDEIAYDAASPKQRKEILGKKMLPQIYILEPNLAPKIMNKLLPMSNTYLIHLLANPSELVKKVCDLINKSYLLFILFLQVKEVAAMVKLQLAMNPPAQVTSHNTTYK
jgi:hypothetical protein